MHSNQTPKQIQQRSKPELPETDDGSGFPT